MLLLSREIQVLKMVEHPNIVYLREILETPEVGNRSEFRPQNA